MKSGHGAYPIFFNKTKRIGRPGHSLTPTFLRLIIISALPPTPLKVDVRCVSPLNKVKLYIKLNYDTEFFWFLGGIYITCIVKTFDLLKLKWS